MLKITRSQENIPNLIENFVSIITRWDGEKGNYMYFYEMEVFYNPEVKKSRERVTKNYGKILIEDYEEKKEIIDNLREKSNVQDLKKYLEEY